MEEIIQSDMKCTPFLDRWDRSLPEDNRTYGMKLLFAGADSKSFRDGLYRVGIRNILASYYYMRKWLEKTPYQEVADDLGRFDFVFLDSGGYTFLSALKEGKKLGMDVKEYAEAYYEALPRVSGLFAGCAEVDVESLGEDYMEGKKDLMVSLGVPIVPVIQGHAKDHIEELGWMSKYPYVAIGSAMVNEPRERANIISLMGMAKEYGVLIHGFGATDAATVSRASFYSVDSTTWLGGARFGNTMIFQNGRIRYYDYKKKDVRRRYRERLENNGIIWEDIEADKAREVNLMNGLAWKQWSDYVRFNAKNSYWLTPGEKDRALSLRSKAFNAEGLIDRKSSLARADARRLETVSAIYDDRHQETLYCDRCEISGICPRFKPNEVCGYDTNIRLQTKEDLQELLRVVLSTQASRVFNGVLFEKIRGGVLDGNVSNEISRLMGMVQQVGNMYDPREELSIHAKGGSGTVAAALAAVFSNNRKGDSGSGSTPTQRAANKVEEQGTIIDAEVLPSEIGESDGRSHEY
jgi:hypothetical protein